MNYQDYQQLDWQAIFNKPVCQLDADNCFVYQTTAELDCYAKDGSYLIPAACVETEPPEPRKNQVAQWQPETQTWQYLPDHRGQTVYNTQTGVAIAITQVGELPENVTTEPRPSEHHAWNGKAWTIPTDTAKRIAQQAFQAALSAKITQLNAAAQEFIAHAAGTDKIPEFEVQSWALQAIEAKAWAADPNADTPVLNEIATARGILTDTLKAAALRKTLAYEKLTAHVVGQRQALQTSIETAKTLDDLNAIVISFTLPESELNP